MNNTENIKLMVTNLLKHCDSVHVACCRHVGVKDKEKMISKKYFNENLIKWFWYENLNNSANILVRPDPQLDHPWLFIDDVPIKKARKCALTYQCIVVETSAHNCQIRLLATQNLSKHNRALVQRQLVELLGSDADLGSIAGCKWGRLVGFPNRKPGRGGFVTNLIALPDPTLPKFNVIPYLKPPTHSELEGVAYVPKNQSLRKKRKNTNEDTSGDDFGYALNRLRFFKDNGLDYVGEAKKLEVDLLARTHKRNPTQYAALTIKSVLKSL